MAGSGSKKGLIGAALVGAAAIGAYLAFGVFGIQTLFTDEVVDEADPFALSQEIDGGSDTGESTSGASGDPSEPAPDVDDTASGEAVEDPATSGEAPSEADDPGTEPTEPAPADGGATPTVETLASGSFIAHDHPGEGTAQVLSDGERAVLRFEDFETDNGPDLNVYLSTAEADGDPGLFDDDFIDLGDLKGNIGDQNYELPNDLDVGRYRSVVVWCVRFGVAFTAAPLDAA